MADGETTHVHVYLRPYQMWFIRADRRTTKVDTPIKSLLMWFLFSSLFFLFENVSISHFPLFKSSIRVVNNANCYYWFDYSTVNQHTISFIDYKKMNMGLNYRGDRDESFCNITRSQSCIKFMTFI